MKGDYEQIFKIFRIYRMGDLGKRINILCFEGAVNFGNTLAVVENARNRKMKVLDQEVI